MRRACGQAPHAESDHLALVNTHCTELRRGTLLSWAYDRSLAEPLLVHLEPDILPTLVRKFSERVSVILLEVRLAVLPRPAARSVAAGVVARRSPRPSAAARRSSHVPGHRAPRHAASANSSPPRRRSQRPHRNMNRHVVKRADLTTARPPRPGAVATPRQ